MRQQPLAILLYSDHLSGECPMNHLLPDCYGQPGLNMRTVLGKFTEIAEWPGRFNYELCHTPKVPRTRL